MRQFSWWFWMALLLVPVVAKTAETPDITFGGNFTAIPNSRRIKKTRPRF